jgi:mannitol-1-phosphate 5-dehydrogenase
VPDDAESVELQAMLRSGRPAGELVTSITGIEPAHPLFAPLVEVVELRLADLA